MRPQTVFCKGVEVRYVYEILDGWHYARFNLPEKFGTLQPFQLAHKRDGRPPILPGPHTVFAESEEAVLLLAKEMIDQYFDE